MDQIRLGPRLITADKMFITEYTTRKPGRQTDGHFPPLCSAALRRRSASECSEGLQDTPPLPVDMLVIQVLMLAIFIPQYLSQKFDKFGRPKCCSDSLSPLDRGPPPWMDTLRQATYQSIIRHLDFSGSLDGRLARDHALWRHLQHAEFITEYDSSGNTYSGLLIDKAPPTQPPTFEYHRTNNNIYECTRGECYTKNNSLLAMWQVRKSDNPYLLWIRVKLPHIQPVSTEDLYEYTVTSGLQKINPDPLQHNSYLSEKSHRFSFSTKNKGDYQSLEREDVRYPNSNKGFRLNSSKGFRGFSLNSNKGFGVGQIIPTSFLYDSATVPERNQNEWIASSPFRRPDSGTVEDTGTRYYKEMTYSTMPSPHGIHHMIQNLPTMSPPQHFHYVSHEVQGFLPSVGPVRDPIPYKTEYAYDPQYVMYYNQASRPNGMPTTTPPKNFKPSTEFVRYSEVDPIFHSKGETDIVQTSPMPEYNLKTTHYPNSINEQLPPNTQSTIGLVNPGFQIVVGDIVSNTPMTTQETTTSLPKAGLPTTKSPNKLTTKPLRKYEGEAKFEKSENNSTKAFGEKIKPKNLSKRPTPVPEIIHTFPPKLEQIPDMYVTKDKHKLTGKILSSTKNNKYNNEKQIITWTSTNPNTNKEDKYTTTKSSKSKINSFPVIEEITTTNILDELELNENGTTSFDIETTTKDEQDLFTTVITDKNVLVLNKSLEINQSERLKTEAPEIESTLFNDFTDETTQANNKTTVIKNENNIYVTSLPDNPETTTDSFEIITTTSKQKSQSLEKDVETQESKQQKVQYRLLTFPGDSVSIVANRISKTVSYKTASGREKKLKDPFTNRYRFSDEYKDYSTIL